MRTVGQLNHDMVADLLCRAANAESRDAQRAALHALDALLTVWPGYEWRGRQEREIGLALYGTLDDDPPDLSLAKRIGRALAVNRRVQWEG